ncbi:MAG: hypothetical protein J6P58_01515 [Oscillospiraceae bacterium]|nr:hypothetical protein [Oscillospiraceae bacterium]
MKKKNARRIARTMGVCVSTAATAALLAGCDLFSPPASLYGPPPLPAETFQVQENNAETLYGPPELFDPDYAPADNIPGEVYGPPLLFKEDDFDPSLEAAEPLYGPPNIEEPGGDRS